MMEYIHQSQEISRIMVVILWKWFCIKDSERVILLAFCEPYLSPKYIARPISIHYYQHRAYSIRKEIDFLIIMFSSSPVATRCPCAFRHRYIIFPPLYLLFYPFSPCNSYLRFIIILAAFISMIYFHSLTFINVQF